MAAEEITENTKVEFMQDDYFVESMRCILCTLMLKTNNTQMGENDEAGTYEEFGQRKILDFQNSR